ncbi:DUF551 domain-containing protein [Cronobacter sakazakii]|uniref:DUF551 domain-containing protein n=1 Tax=Cronobacter sakazakii TaxID=28141 RepID=UPI000E073DEB|nr:DUF551 domain-containing protein [Cronobacter sakazakii]STD04985.1 Protein of uncharacterised function (DUF551) [Cronobacter sakazakii]
MSTISTERLESLQRQFKEEGFNDISDSEVMQLVEENLALRKERERADPVAYMIGGHYLMHANDPKVDNYSSAVALYTAPPAPEVPAAYEINDDATDYHLGWNACRAAMLKSGNDDIGSWSNHKNTPTDKPKSEMSQQAEQLLRDTTALAATLSEETDTTAQQFEELLGKAVGGWIACSERMPEICEEVLMRISCNDHFNIESGKYKGDGLWLGCWFSTYGKKGSPYQVAHWMPIPAAPDPCK